MQWFVRQVRAGQIADCAHAIWLVGAHAASATLALYCMEISVSRLSHLSAQKGKAKEMVVSLSDPVSTAQPIWNKAGLICVCSFAGIVFHACCMPLQEKMALLPEHLEVGCSLQIYWVPLLGC